MPILHYLSICLAASLKTKLFCERKVKKKINFMLLKVVLKWKFKFWIPSEN